MRQVPKVVIPSLAAALLLAACGSGSSGSGQKPTAASAPNAGAGTSPVVKSAANPKLGATVLVDSKGLTLYHLSAEGAGKWICTTAGCTANWHPLTTTGGAALGGTVGSLGTVKRPDGTMQITYKGEPLYTFAGDSGPGDAAGQGIKDVGTWTAVATGKGKASTKASSAPAPASSSSGGGAYGY